MNANTFDELCNDLFQSFLNNAPDYLIPLTQKYGQVELDNIIQQAIDRVLGWIDRSDISHFNDETHDLVQMKAIQTLTGEFGGVLGVDVSVDRNRLKKVLSRDTPPNIIDPGLIQIFVWEDILIAMGITNGPKDARGELLICKEDLCSIAKVWKNDGGNMSIELLVDTLGKKQP